MADSYSFGVTNTTASEYPLATTALGLKSNYGSVYTAPGRNILINGTGNGDVPEAVVIYSRPTKQVWEGQDWKNAKIRVTNPDPIKDGVIYGVKTYGVLRKTAADGTIVDYPYEVSSFVKHGITAPWTNSSGVLDPSYVKQILERNVSVYFTDDGLERFNVLRRGILEPNED